jgi:hypothetical protein
MGASICAWELLRYQRAQNLCPLNSSSIPTRLRICAWELLKYHRAQILCLLISSGIQRTGAGSRRVKQGLGDACGHVLALALGLRT